MPACHNILHCHPEQLFPFLSPVWLIQLLYWEGKSGGGGGGGGQKQQQKSQRDAVILSFGSEMSQKTPHILSVGFSIANVEKKHFTCWKIESKR